MSKSPKKPTRSDSTVADQVAEFIGRSMGELLNKKDTLSKQIADVDKQIADVRHRVVRQFGDYLPSKATRRRISKAAARVQAVGEQVRAVTEETRQKMAEAARRRWARERTKKAKR